MLEYIILGFLLHGDMSGYDIKQYMKNSTANFYDASFGSIYPMLKKMEEELTVCSKEVVDNGKYRKVYSITESGRIAFFQWLEQPIELNRAKHDHLVRMFFFSRLPPAKVRTLVGDFIKTVGVELTALEALEKQIGCNVDFFEISTLDFGKDYYRFTMQWCEAFLKKLDQLDNLENRK